MCAAAQAPAKNFANLLSTAKSTRNFKNITPPVEAISQIVETAKASLPAELSARIDFTIIYDEKMKTRMVQASEEMFQKLYEKAENEIDKAKLHAYMHYTTSFIKAPVVIALHQKSPFDMQLNDMMHSMSACSKVYGLDIHELTPQLSAHKEFAEILGLTKPARVLTIIAVGYPQ